MSDLIVVPEGRGIAEVSWPAYKRASGGTCDFMTVACAKHCKLTTNDIERNSLKYFEENEVAKVSRKLISDMNELNADILCWFIGSGDCPKQLTSKLVDIAKTMSGLGIIQHGFTRNIEFWEYMNLIKNVSVVLTVEKGQKSKMAKAIEMQNNYLYEEPAPVFMVGEPDYEMRTVNIFRPTYNERHYTTGCGGGWVTEIGRDGEINKTTVEDCSICLKNNDGCYSILKGSDDRKI